jgi:hypothetical protein
LCRRGVLDGYLSATCNYLKKKHHKSFAGRLKISVRHAQDRTNTLQAKSLKPPVLLLALSPVESASQISQRFFA